MKKLIVAILVSASFAVSANFYVTAYKTGERVTGMTKQCYYKFGNNQYTKTVKSHELCPLSIKVKQ